MKRMYLFLASLLVSLVSLAQWTKPATPTALALPTDGTGCYLFNIDAEGFLVGANDWGTRASVSATLGHKCYLEAGSQDGSYYLTNDVLQGGMAGKLGYMFMTDYNNIWVDNTKTGQKNNQYTFAAQGNNIYKIGLSPANETYQDTEAFLGIIPEMKDTRLYFCDPSSTTYDVTGYQTRWIFVTPDDYTTYIAARAQYDAAVKLGAAIEKAKAENAGIDLSVVEAIYNNTSSSAEVLTAALTTTRDLVVAFQTAKASVDTPADYSAMLTNASYDDNTKDGWTGADNSSVSYNVSEFYSWDAGWGSATYDYNQSLSSLPEGVYRVGVTGYYRSGTNAADYEHFKSEDADSYRHAKLYITTTAQGTTYQPLPLQSAGASSTALGGSTYTNGAGEFVPNNMETANAYFQAGQYEPTTILCYVNDGKLTVGLKKTEHETDNWTIWDNWTVKYLGDADAAYKVLSAEALERHTDYEEEEKVYCQQTVWDAYVAAKEALTKATDKASVTTALPTFEQSFQALESSISAYAGFVTKFNEAKNWINKEMTAENEYTDSLVAYICDDYEEGFNGHGSAYNILENGTLDNTQIAAELTYLEELFYNAKANSMSDGDDCTNMLVNPNFAVASEGWLGASSTTNITWPAGDATYPVMQAHNVAFDLYQNLTGLQNGLYEMDLQAAFRPGDSYSYDYDEVRPYAYINGFKVKIPSGIGVGDGNSINEASEASTHFTAGEYPVTVYGLVTDGTMKIGVTNEVRTNENCRLWAGGVKLIFRAKNEEALTKVIGSTITEAEELKSSLCGKPELDAMESAVSTAQQADGSTELYDALIALKASMDSVEAGVTIYQNLSVALTSLDEAINNATEKTDATTLAEAKSYYETTYTAYYNQTLSSSEAEDAIAQLNSYSVAIKMGKGGSEDEPVDYTSAIVNNNYDPAKGDKASNRADGWTISVGSLNGYKEYSCSFNKNPFDISQTLSGLPKGKYKVTVHTYYRAGSYDEEAAHINAGDDTHLMKLYADASDMDYEVDVMNLSEGSDGQTLPEGINTKTINSITVPDGTSASVACFNAGLFLNELTFIVGEDGKATIGLKLEKTIGTNDYTVIGQWNLYYYGEEKALEEQDVSSLIVNNNYDPAKGDKASNRADGWTISVGSLNGYKEYSCSFNKNPFNINQKLTGLPEGTYKATVHTYYRAGSYDEEAANINAGKDTHLMQFYATTTDRNYYTPVMNLSEGCEGQTLPETCTKTSTINGIIVPDGTSPSVACFNAGMFLNELPFYVNSDGEVTIGLKLDKTIGTNDYTVIGEWNLYYYGSGDHVDEIVTPVEVVKSNVTSAMPVGFYNLNGVRLSQPQRGINIIKMADGTTRKVLVK